MPIDFSTLLLYLQWNLCLAAPEREDQYLFLRFNDRLMPFKSIAECSHWSILQYFRPSLSYHLSVRYLFCLFLSGRLRQVLLHWGLVVHFYSSSRYDIYKVYVENMVQMKGRYRRATLLVRTYAFFLFIEYKTFFWTKPRKESRMLQNHHLDYIQATTK